MTYSPMLAPHRARSERRGRPKSGTNFYCIPGTDLSVGAGTKVAQPNVDEYVPWFASSPMLIDQLALEITTADSGQSLRMGFYAADQDMQPVGPPLADSGTISLTSTGVKTYTPSTPVYVPRGPYLSVINTTSSFNAGMRLWSGGPAGIATTMGSVASVRWAATRTYAAFPTPGAVWTAVTAGASGGDSWGYHFVVYRVSAV